MQKRRKHLCYDSKKGVFIHLIKHLWQPQKMTNSFHLRKAISKETDHTGPVLCLYMVYLNV